MAFQSLTYLFFFLPAVAILHAYVKNTSWRPAFLTIAGYLFYAWGEPWIAILLFATSAADFVIGLRIEAARSAATRTFWLVLSLAGSLGLLAVFKYGTWAIDNLNVALEASQAAFRIPRWEVTLPPGISFYTFQSISYVVDVYRRRVEAHKNVVNYFAFISFFPQLIAGPIERAGHLLPQIVRAKKITARMVEAGLFLIVWGLFKKLVVADNLGNIVELSKGNPSDGAWIVMALAFTFQIYADFSAYTDIARGSARLLGVNLVRNFHTPYFATSPSDFWARWHISLSTWIRDYLYIPLGGNRLGNLKTLRNLVVTMALAGLWHGAGWYFILWGLYHGLLLLVYRLLPIDQWLMRTLGDAGAWIARALMFLLTIGGWILFLAGEGTMADLFAPNPALTAPLATATLLWGLALFSAPIILSDSIAFAYRREFPDLGPHMHWLAKGVLYVVIFYSIVMFGARDTHDFIYFRF